MFKDLEYLDILPFFNQENPNICEYTPYNLPSCVLGKLFQYLSLSKKRNRHYQMQPEY